MPSKWMPGRLPVGPSAWPGSDQVWLLQVCLCLSCWSLARTLPTYDVLPDQVFSQLTGRAGLVLPAASAGLLLTPLPVLRVTQPSASLQFPPHPAPWGEGLHQVVQCSLKNDPEDRRVPKWNTTLCWPHAYSLLQMTLPTDATSVLIVFHSQRKVTLPGCEDRCLRHRRETTFSRRRAYTPHTHCSHSVPV